MRVKFHRNTSDKRFGTATLPRRQRFLWLGPLFVHIVRKGA